MSGYAGTESNYLSVDLAQPEPVLYVELSAVTIELPPQQTQTAYNLRLWAELIRNPQLARIEGRIETDRHGHIIMSPPPGANHGSYQSEVAHLSRTLMGSGRTLTECPISTADGVKAADVAWASGETMRARGNYACFPKAPEICVEILSIEHES